MCGQHVRVTFGACEKLMEIPHRQHFSFLYYTEMASDEKVNKTLKSIFFRQIEILIVKSTCLMVIVLFMVEEEKYVKHI